MVMICDDRIYAPGGLMDQVRGMSDEEFEIFMEKRKKAKEEKEKK